MKILFFVRTYATKCRHEVFRLVFCCVSLYITFILVPYITGNYIDCLTAADDATAIWRCVGTLAAVWTIQIVLSYLKNMAGTKASARVSYFIEEDVLEQVKRLPLSFFTKNDGTYIGHRIISDAATVTQFVLLSLVSFLTDVLSLIVSAAVTIMIDSHVFLIILAAAPLYASVYLIFKKPIYDLSYKCREHENRFFSKINRQLSHIKPVKQHVYYERLRDEMRSSYKELYSLTVKHARFGYLFGNADSFLRYIVTLSVFVFSGYGILKGKMTVGSFTMINSYTMMLISALSGILGLGKSYRTALVSYNRINELRTLPTEHNGTFDPGKIEQICIRDLSFSFDNRLLIDKLSCTLTKGNIYGVVGLNGSGKSTFIDLITGVIEEYTGEIFYNDENLRNVELYELRRHRIAIVEQEPSLIFDSIGDISAEFEKGTAAQRWLDKLGMGELINRYIDAGHRKAIDISLFSGGEKQRMILARALAKDADVMILDEPSSAIDGKTLEQLISIIKQQAPDKIILLITHEPSLIAICNTLIRL